MKQIILTGFMFLLICNALNAQSDLKDIKPYKVLCTTTTGKYMVPVEVDTAKGRSVANNDLIWDNGSVLLVKFMNNIGGKSLRNTIMQFAKQWEQFANITLKFVPDSTPQTNIRILLGGGPESPGHNSAVGIDCDNTSQLFQTMNLDTSDFIDYDAYIAEFKSRGPFYQFLVKKGYDIKKYDGKTFYEDVWAYPDPNMKWVTKIIRRKTQHEFGHALGLLHEQSYPGAIKWNKDTVYKHYKKTQKWNKEQVDLNVLEASEVFYTNGTKYDPLSIMHYDVHSWQTIDGYSLEQSYEISEGDKKIMAALYPKNLKISLLAVPRVQVSKITNVLVKNDNIRKGMVVHPQFDLKSSPVPGKIFFVARLTTEDGTMFIQTSNVNYKWSGAAATYLKMNLLPNSNISYNKAPKKNLELFFPYKEMPELAGKKVKVHFSIFVDDEKNNRYNKVVFDFLSAPLSLPK